jgi:copper chaperone CopZ
VTALPLRSGESPLQTTMLVVPAMHCAGCMAKVERGLGDVPGVNAARVNLTARQVRVEHDPAVAIPQLVDALANAGFASQPRGEEMVPPPSAVKPLLAPLAMAGFACMNVMLMSALCLDRGAGDPLRGHAVLHLGLECAEAPHHQHGRADLDRRHASHRAERI